MKKNLSLILVLIFISTFAFGEKFEFQYVKGDTYRILSTVQEDVIINRQLHHQANITNRISVEVTDVNPDGSGVHNATFMTTENVVGSGSDVKTWGKEYDSIFTRSKNGKYTISDLYFMPVVRDVPVFPDKDLQPGDTWEAEGHEAHDLRTGFKINTPYKIPFTAYYTYQGPMEQNGKTLHVIKVVYNLYYNSPELDLNSEVDGEFYDYPVSTMGFSDQTIYWDNERGCIENYNEKFRIQMETKLGHTYVYKGTAGAEVQELKRVKNEATIEKVEEELSKLGIEDANVKTDDKGITISIENIQFKADSAILENSEQEKLKKIAGILQSFPDNDLLISGHTALAGSPESCQILSEERASSVARFLLNLGVKDSEHIFTQGFGATKPIAPNSSTSGMARNRRVEITIMEK